jgi:hypothetical protein
MSPEQAHGGNTDHRSDLYSLGCIMYEALAGRPLFSGDNSVQIMLHHINTSPKQALSALLFKSHSKSLVAVLEKLLEKKPQRRYQSAAELSADLRRVLQGKHSKAMLTKMFHLDISSQAAVGLVLAALIIPGAVASAGLIFGPRLQTEQAPIRVSDKLLATQVEKQQLISKLAGSNLQSVRFAVKALFSLATAGFDQPTPFSMVPMNSDVLTESDQDALVSAYSRFNDPQIRHDVIGALNTATKPSLAAFNLLCNVSKIDKNRETMPSPWAFARWARHTSVERQLAISTALSELLLTDCENEEEIKKALCGLSRFSDEAVNNIRKSAATTDAGNSHGGYYGGTDCAHPLLRVCELRHQYYPELLALTSSPHAASQTWELIKKLGPEAKDAVSGIIKLLDETTYRAQAIDALGAIGPAAAPQAVPVLERSLFEPPVIDNGRAAYYTQTAVAKALGKMGEQGIAVLKRAASTRNHDKELRSIAERSLYRASKQSAEIPSISDDPLGPRQVHLGHI